LALKLGWHTLHVRGYIDRIDVEDRKTLVRDLKTGRAKSRVAALALPNPILDVQIALYGMVAKALSEKWKIPKEVQVAYAYASPRGDRERAFRDDFGNLEAAAKGWLSVAAGLLKEHSFPRTPNEDDCRYCVFQPVCGNDARARAVAVLKG